MTKVAKKKAVKVASVKSQSKAAAKKETEPVETTTEVETVKEKMPDVLTPPKEKTLGEEILLFINDESRDKGLSLEGIVDAVFNKTYYRRDEVERWVLGAISEGYVSQVGNHTFSLTEKGLKKINEDNHTA